MGHLDFFFFPPASWNFILYICTLVVSHNLKESFITFLELFLNATLSSLILCTISRHLSSFELWYLSSQVSETALLCLCIQTQSLGNLEFIASHPHPSGITVLCSLLCPVQRQFSPVLFSRLLIVFKGVIF